MNDEILDFIKKRFSNTDANWLYGNCYYFAQILCMRFPWLKVYYEPVAGHFIAGTPSHYYDWRGLVTNQLDSKPILLDWIKDNEPNWYNRLLEDCIL